jgi:hypothetical protein
MTRKQQIALKILDALSGWDAPAHEAVIFQQVQLHFDSCLLSEFDEALAFCQEERLATGTADPLRGTLWSITNKGRAMRRA